MIECRSTRGKWGSVCPACGAMLPNPKPIKSWMATRDHHEDHVREPLPESRYRLHRNDRRAA